MSKDPFSEFGGRKVDQPVSAKTPFDEFGGRPVSSKKKVPTVEDGILPSEQEDAGGVSGFLDQVITSPLGSSFSSNKDEGEYYYPGNTSSLYKKEAGQWYVDYGASGNFKPITTGDVEKRVRLLERNAIPKGEGTYVPDIGNRADVVIDEAKWSTEPEIKPGGEVKPKEKSEGQRAFEQDFGILAEDDPIVLERKKVNELSKKVSNAVFMEEEEAVPMLQAEFSKDPKYDIFDFEEYGLGDKLRVTNKKTGQHIIIDLDNFSSRDAQNEKKLLEAFIDANLEFPEYNDLIERRNKLSEEMSAAVSRPKWEIQQEMEQVNGEIRVQESMRRGYALSQGPHTSAVIQQKYDHAKRDNQDILKNELTSITTRTTDLKKRIKENNDYKQWLSDGLKSGSITEEEYNSRLSDPATLANDELISKEAQSIVSDSKDLLKRADQNDQIAAQAYQAMKWRGDATSNAIASFLKGFTGTIRFLKDIDDQTHGRPKDEAKFSGEFFSEALPGELSEEYVNNPDLPDWEKALVGISESLGAALSTGPMGGAGAVKNIGIAGLKSLVAKEGVKRASWEITKNFVKKSLTPDQIGLFVNSYSNFKDQMDKDPAFDEVPEWEKVTVSAAYGLVSGKLEHYGLTKSLSKTPMGKNLNAYILKNVFSQIPKNASAEVIESAIDGNIKSLIAKGILNTAGSSFIEGSTEAAQEIADMSLKEAYNEIKGKDYFDNPKTIADAYDRVSESFKIGMLGGAMMNGTAQALSAPKSARTAIQMQMIEKTIKDPDLKEAFQNNIRVKVLNGEMTKEQAKATLDEMRSTEGVINKIPEEVTEENADEAFKLVSEKQELVSKIEGKDPALAAADKERVAIIDEQLKGMSYASAAPVVTEMDTRIEAETIPERKSTLVAAQNVEKAFEGKVRVIVHENSSDYATAINEVSEVKETDENRTSARYIPSTNEIHVDLDTADAMSPYHEAFHAKVKTMDKPQLGKFVADLGNVVKGNEELLTRVNTFAEQYGDQEGSMSEEKLAELTGIMADSAIKLEKTGFQKFVEFINKVASGIGLSSILKKTASRGEVVDFLNGLSKSLRAGESVEIDTDTSLGEESSRRIPQVRINALRSFDAAYQDLVDQGVTPEDAFTQATTTVSEGISDDILREEVIRDINRKYGKTLKSAPRVERVIGKPKPTRLVVDEAKALVDVIKRESKAARDKKAQVKDVLTNISSAVSEMNKRGEISVRQMNSIMSAMKGLNMDNKVMVDRFIGYINNVVSKAEYADKVNEAMTIRKRIKKSFKNKANPFVSVAKGFSELNPKWVENIDEYLDIAGKVRDSLKPSTVREGKITFKQEADIREVGAYTAKEQEAQNEIAVENARIYYERVTGDSAAGRSVGELNQDLIERTKDGGAEIKDQVNQALKEKLAEFKQEVSAEDPKEVQDAVNINIDLLDTRTAIRILDALDSYMANGTIAGLKSQMAAYRGLSNVDKTNLKGGKLRVAGSKKLGRLQNEQFTNMNILTERIFRGVNKGAQFRKESGVQEIINGSNRAETESIRKQNEYLKKFGKTKKFDSAENIYERSVIAFLRRNVVDGDQEAEFARRKKLLQDSANTLKTGNDIERKKAELYQKVLDKLGVTEDATLESIEAKAEKTNIDAVDFIVDMWSELYPDLADFSLGVYDIMLPRDSNYTPDRFASMEQSQTLEDEIQQDSFGFSAFNHMILDRNEAGVLMESKKPKKLPKGRFIDLDFDTNMFRSYRLALTDMYTAEPIRQSISYINSPKFSEMVNADDRKILQASVSDYVRAKKGKAYTDRDTMDFLKRLSNGISALGAARALGGFGQFVNQFSTGLTNTFVNVGMNLHLSDMFDKNIQELINNSGRGIANRGVEVVTTIDKADNIVKSVGIGRTIQRNTTDKVAQANVFMLKWLLSKPDVLAARLAWAAYYRKSLKEQGLDPVFDASNINDKAADYAQAMVDRNMDVSDTELRGKFFRDKTSWKNFIKQVYFPFATFALNQKNRMWNDASVLASPLSSAEDKVTAARSLLALFSEMAVYNGVRYAVGRMVLEAALESLGLDDEEKKEYTETYKQNISESVLAKSIQDLFSPTPVMDDATIKATNWLIRESGMADPEKKFQELIKEKNAKRAEDFEDPMSATDIEKARKKFYEENTFQFYVDDEKDYGNMGIQLDKVIETYDMWRAWYTGEYTQESKFGSTDKILSEEGQEAMTLPLILKTSASIVAPREAGQMADRMFKVIKKKYGATEGQADKVKQIEKLGYKVDDNVMKMVKTPRGVDGIIEELDYMKGMTSKEKQNYMRDELGL